MLTEITPETFEVRLTQYTSTTFYPMWRDGSKSIVLHDGTPTKAELMAFAVMMRLTGEKDYDAARAKAMEFLTGWGGDKPRGIYATVEERHDAMVEMGLDPYGQNSPSDPELDPDLPPPLIQPPISEPGPGDGEIPIPTDPIVRPQPMSTPTDEAKKTPPGQLKKKR